MSFSTIKEKSKSIKESICAIISQFINNSGIEKFTLEALGCALKEKEIPNLSPKSFVKLPQSIIFSEDNNEPNPLFEEVNFRQGLEFFLKMHYSLKEMMEQETNPKIQVNILKALYYLVLKTPYSKMQFGLISETVLPFVVDHYKNRENDNSVSEAYTDQTRISKLDTHINQLVKVLFSVKELKHEIRDNFSWEYFKHFLIPYEMNIEILAMVGRNYPEVMYRNWDALKEFSNSVLYVDNRKLHLALLKMFEEWLNNFNKIVTTKDEDNSKSRRIIKNDVFGGSSSTLSKKSEEEDKSSTDSQDSDRYSSNGSKDSHIHIKLEEMDPFTMASFREFLKSTFDWFLLNSSDTDIHCIILNIFSFMREENWEELYEDHEIVTIFDIIDRSKNISCMKTASIKFLGYIIYHQRIHTNEETVKYIIHNLYSYKKENNMQV